MIRYVEIVNGNLWPKRKLHLVIGLDEPFTKCGRVIPWTATMLQEDYTPEDGETCKPCLKRFLG